MARHEKGSRKPHYQYAFGLKALENGQTVDLYEDTKKNLFELCHFIVQNSNYAFSELQKMDIRDVLSIYQLVEDDIKRKIEISKR